MFKKILPALGLAVMSLLATGPTAQAQAPANDWRPCGYDELQQQYYATHPGAEQQYRAFLQQVATDFAANSSSQRQINVLPVVPDVVVPVVIHVLYTDPASNVPDRRIDDAMAILNRDFRGANADTALIIPRFKQRIAGVGFEFRLARIDPNGNCTTGITRHYSSESLTGTRAVTQIPNAYWDRNKYLNIWIVAGIASGAGGYTFGGALGCPPEDGIVLRSGQFGPNANCNLCERSLTHEVGHYFGLPHTWGGTNTPGLASNCSLDDGIADTPNTSGYSQASNGACNTNYGTCLDASGNRIISNVQNYMDYADCESMFTAGQKAVMRAALNNSACRRNLVSAANLRATGTNDGYVAVPCAPVASFLTTDTTVCVNSPVSVRDYSYNANSSGGALTYTWSFPGGTPATATGPTATVRYATPGYYTITETVTNSVSSVSITKNNVIRVDGPSAAGPAVPYTESFEGATGFPNVRPVPSLFNWLTYGVSGNVVNDLARFRLSSSGVAAYGVNYLFVNAVSLETGTISTAVTPSFDLRGNNVPQEIKFSVALQLRSSGSLVTNSELRVAFSNDCGATWSQPTTFNAAALNTKGAALPSFFVPQSRTDWQDLTVPIPAPYAGSSTFKVRFQYINASDAGTRTNLYFDDLRVGGGSLSTQSANLAERGISVYPNPATQETAVRLTLPKATQVQVRLTDVLGREVLALPAKTYAAGNPEISLNLAGRQLPAGIYVVRISLDGETFNSKLTVR